MHLRARHWLVLLALAATFGATPAHAKPRIEGTPAISGGAEAYGLARQIPRGAEAPGSPVEGTDLKVFTPGTGFLAYNFNDNATENGGFLFIPPDPIGVAGMDRLIGVVNTGIECRTKTGTLIFRDSLKDFFSPLGAATLGSYGFDPKIVYDHYEDRFVVVTLERWSTASGDPSNESRILVAVSKTGSPATSTAADWWYTAINAKTNIGGVDHWADYPGFEVDEEAVYITANMFTFAGAYGGVRLWIIDKGVGPGFYAGGAAAVSVHDPVPGGYYATTMGPALVHGAGGVGGAGSTIGTYLVAFSGLSDGVDEYLQVIRVDNPLAGPTFSGQFVNISNIDDNAGGLTDAPQLGSVRTIEVNDRRLLDAVWRDDSLWAVTTINPGAGYDPVNAGQTTAHWIRLDASVPAAMALAEQGNIGGEDIAPGAYTFFPSLAVNGNGDAVFGFAASASTIYCGAYYAGREAGDAPGTVQPAGVVRAGVDYYYRAFGGTRNRWGDYTGAAVDPADDSTFWIYNEYAETRGTLISGEDGRWGTAWKAVSLPSPTIIADVYPLVPLSGPVSVFALPNGAGTPLTAVRQWNGVPGSPPVFVDATIVVQLRDGGGAPVVGFPADKIGVVAQAGGWVQCPGSPLTADGPTDAAGITTISGALHAGGYSAPGELLQVVVDSPLLSATNYPGGLAGLQYKVNSADINGDLDVDILDLPPMANAYGTPAYRGDFVWDGITDIVDLPLLAGGYGASCPVLLAAGAAAPQAAVGGEIGVVFDLETGATGRAAAPDEPVDAYVVLRGAAADAGVEAFDARVRVSDNVRVLERGIVGDGIDVAPGADFVVGLTDVRRAGGGDLVLARLRVAVTDAEPAHIWLEPSAVSGLRLPTVAGGDRIYAVRPVSGDVAQPVAGLNDKAFDDGTTPAARRLSLSIAPNPFNPMTEIRFALPAAGRVELRVYDAAGMLVTTLADEVRPAGDHVVVWNGTDAAGRRMASGVYFSSLRTSSGTLLEKMLLMK